MMVERPIQPDCLDEFQHINRYWDRVHNVWAAKILPGEFYVTNNYDEAISTTLGSCVSACIRDKELGIGGINHFMLPEKKAHSSDDWMSAATRYGSYAMESLINAILKNGGHRRNLEVKLAGGGKVLEKLSDVGAQNIEFALNYFETEGLPVISQDLGDIYPRKLMYFPATGLLRIKRLKSLHNKTVLEREYNYQTELGSQPDSGGVELF